MASSLLRLPSSLSSQRFSDPYAHHELDFATFASPSIILHVFPSSLRQLNRSPRLVVPSKPLRVSLFESRGDVSHSHDNEPRETTTKNSVWVNPRSPHSARLRHSYDSRYTRLTDFARSLDACSHSDLDISELFSPFGNDPSEQDAVIVLNNVENPQSALLALHWFQGKISLNREAILYNVTLKVFRKRRDWEGLVSLMNEMIRNGIKLDNITFSTVISCARLCNLPALAVEWFQRMPEFGCSPDNVTLSAMIDAYGRSGNVAMALELYDRAREERWRVDSVTFATVIRVHSNSGNFDGALNVFQEMKVLGAKPNVVIFNTLLDAMGRAGRPWQVKTIYKEMQSLGLSPNRGTYSALLRAFSKARYAEDALKVYKEMKEQGVELNVILYNMLLSMCADLGLVNEAVGLFQEMKMLSGECKPDSWSYSSLITAYSCCGQVSEVESAFSEMLEAGFQPNIFVLTSIIQCYGKARKIDDVVRTFNKLLELGITPDDRFCGCLLNVLTQTPLEDIDKIVGCILSSNAQLGSVVRLLVDKSATNQLIRREVEELINSVSSEVKKAFCNCLIDLCVNLEFLERACVLLDVALQFNIYSTLQSKSTTQWSLHLKSLSAGAAFTALHIWMNDLSNALGKGEELPPLLGIHTGHGKHKYSEKGLASMFDSLLKEMDAPFHEAPDKVGWFLTTKIAAETWLKSRSLPELAAT